MHHVPKDDLFTLFIYLDVVVAAAVNLWKTCNLLDKKYYGTW